MNNDREWLYMALQVASNSPDPATKVGCVIVTADGRMKVPGWNHFPPGLTVTDEMLHNRDTKLEHIIHAEAAAVHNAARTGTPISGGTIYIAATDDSGEIWGGPPCWKYGCLKCVADAGVKRIVSYRLKQNSKWRSDFEKSFRLLKELGMTYLEVPPPAENLEDVVRFKARKLFPGDEGIEHWMTWAFKLGLEGKEEKPVAAWMHEAAE